MQKIADMIPSSLPSVSRTPDVGSVPEAAASGSASPTTSTPRPGTASTTPRPTRTSSTLMHLPPSTTPRPAVSESSRSSAHTTSTPGTSNAARFSFKSFAPATITSAGAWAVCKPKVDHSENIVTNPHLIWKVISKLINPLLLQQSKKSKRMRRTKKLIAKDKRVGCVPWFVSTSYNP